MSLDPLQDQVVRIALALPEARTLVLAGGGAMLAHQFVDRVTKDIDVFTDRDNAEDCTDDQVPAEVMVAIQRVFDGWRARLQLPEGGQLRGASDPVQTQQQEPPGR